MKVRPLTLKQANEYVERLHRHHKPCAGHRFSLGLFSEDEERLIGVVICGRPVARKTDQYTTLEITRCCTDGTKNAISKLYGHVVRIAKEMGFKSVQTFTLPEEGGASMKASGFTFCGEAGGGSWNNAKRKRRTDQPEQIKHKWVKILE